MYTRSAALAFLRSTTSVATRSSGVLSRSILIRPLPNPTFVRVQEFQGIPIQSPRNLFEPPDVYLHRNVGSFFLKGHGDPRISLGPAPSYRFFHVAGGQFGHPHGNIRQLRQI